MCDLLLFDKVAAFIDYHSIIIDESVKSTCKKFCTTFIAQPTTDVTTIFATDIVTPCVLIHINNVLYISPMLKEFEHG